MNFYGQKKFFYLPNLAKLAVDGVHFALISGGHNEGVVADCGHFMCKFIAFLSGDFPH